MSEFSRRPDKIRDDQSSVPSLTMRSGGPTVRT
jgi:hypothetical protein